MTTTLKTGLLALATLVLANCSGSENLSDLPVRDGPQSASPASYSETSQVQEVSIIQPILLAGS
jgi:hypothetical protein